MPPIPGTPQRSEETELEDVADHRRNHDELTSDAVDVKVHGFFALLNDGFKIAGAVQEARACSGSRCSIFIEWSP